MPRRDLARANVCAKLSLSYVPSRRCARDKSPPCSPGRSPCPHTCSLRYALCQLRQRPCPFSDRKHIEKLKEDVREALLFGNGDETLGTLEKLELIDALQRLGIDYLFKNEIERILHDAFENKANFVLDNDLHSKALYFRLLRQHGYEVSHDVFNDFMDERGNFKDGICIDVKGMLSLYDASHLGFEGEDTMYKAMAFTTKKLKLIDDDENIEQSLKEEVSHALELPLHWRMARLDVRWHIDVHNIKYMAKYPSLLEFAKFDFNMVQEIHQKELAHMSRWWENLGLSKKLSFARDRLVESFLWCIGLAYEPQLEHCRTYLTKIGNLIFIIDDIYDIYGSIDELELFTSAVERWEINAIEVLPDYMKICFLVLYNTINEMVYTTLKERGYSALQHLKKAWENFCRSMLVEAKWSKKNYMPTLEEYLANAWISSSTPLVHVHAFFASKQNITAEALDSLNSDSDLVYYSSMIFRLCNDLVTSSAEQERGDVPSAIQCYMCETNATEKVAREKIRDIIMETWRKMNKSVFDTPFSPSFVNIIENHARNAHCFYQHGDGISVQDHVGKKRVQALLVKPIV
ncbi:hypothetical protein Sjap_002899 [Stephania japonica]|uniref:Uncharacterized protein n=1 Tax=Stephania japonica TaxID=461633 RepID=A0AAP0KPG3_9MAGN